MIRDYTTNLITSLAFIFDNVINGRLVLDSLYFYSPQRKVIIDGGESTN